MTNVRFRYRWSSWGDLNAFFGLTLDNLSNLVLLWGILKLVGFPDSVYFGKMVPGTALGVLVGDLVYTWMAFRLAKREGRHDVTAMPLGLDTPSTIGIGVAVLMPAFLAARQSGLSPEAAGDVTWKVGMATLVFMGLVKTGASFFGDAIRRKVPQAGLLGSLAGVGITLLGFLPFKEIYTAPVVGLVALGLLLYSLVARLRLPGNLPGAFAAVLAGTAVYYILGGVGLLPLAMELPQATIALHIPWPTLAWWDSMGIATAYLPLAIPFGLLTIVGGINVTESARCAGDNFNTRNVLLTEAMATLVAGVCGGVAQSTPYIGHPAYKAMGARSAYTLAAGLFVGIGGMLGIVSWVVSAIPAAAVAPILLFVGIEIGGQAFIVCPKRHYPAIFVALLPVIGELVRISMETVLGSPAVWDLAMQSAGVREFAQLAMILGHGFIVTSMLWGGAVAHLIDGRLWLVSGYFGVMSALTFFGFIHSVERAGDVYLPWTLSDPGAVIRLSLAYLLLGAMILVLGALGRGKTQAS